MEKDAFKLKLQELGRVVAEVGNIVDVFSKEYDNQKKEKDVLQSMIETARDEHKKLLTNTGAYKDEFNKKKAEDQKELDNQKKSTKQIQDLAEEKLSQAEKALLEAQKKEERANGLVADAEKYKKEYFDKKEEIRAFLTSKN